jgi:hypothetical protein
LELPTAICGASTLPGMILPTVLPTIQFAFLRFFGEPFWRLDFGFSFDGDF